MGVVTIARDRDCVAHGCTLALVDSPEPPGEVAALLTKKLSLLPPVRRVKSPVSDFNDGRKVNPKLAWRRLCAGSRLKQ